MSQFQVPQFIETEDRIVGPLTIKQFLYLAAGGALLFITYFLLATAIWFILAFFIGAISLALAFIKYNGRPLPIVLISAFVYLWRPRQYSWQREEGKIAIPEIKIPKIPKKSLWEQFHLVPKAGTPTETTPIEPQPAMLKDLQLKLTTSTEMGAIRPASKEHRNELFQLFKKLTGEREIARRVDYR